MNRGTESGFGRIMDRRRFLKTAAVVGGGLLAAGCAGGGTQATKEAVKLGVLLPYSKVYAVLGESITNGMKLYFNSIGNEAGGRKIDMLLEDSEMDTDVGLRKARKFIESDKVDLMTGLVSSGVAYALRDLVHSTKTILIISNAGANEITRSKKSPYIFRTSFSNWQPNYPMGEWVARNLGKKVFVSAPDYAAGHEMIDAFKETFVSAGGEIIGEVYPPLGTNDYGPYLAEISKARPEVSYSFYSGSDAANFVRQFGEYRLNEQIKLAGAGFMLEEDVLPAQGEAALGGHSGLHWAYTLDTPENKDFVAAYEKEFGKAANVFAVQGYDTARVIAEALNAVQGDTSNKDALIEAIAAVKFASPRGPFEFDPETHNVIQNIYIREVVDVGGTLHNQVVDTVERVRDPGQ